MLVETFQTRVFFFFFFCKGGGGGVGLGGLELQYGIVRVLTNGLVRTYVFT